RQVAGQGALVAGALQALDPTRGQGVGDLVGRAAELSQEAAQACRIGHGWSPHAGGGSRSIVSSLGSDVGSVPRARATALLIVVGTGRAGPLGCVARNSAAASHAASRSGAAAISRAFASVSPVRSLTTATAFICGISNWRTSGSVWVWPTGPTVRP